MKYLVLTIVAAMSFTACNSEGNKESAAGDTTAAAPVETMTEQPVAAAGPIDPVCAMTKDSTWTEYAVTGADTTWFCSETCKTAYTANPAKYQAKS